MQAGHVKVQGRDLQVLRFHQNAGQDSGDQSSAGRHAGEGVWVDVTPVGGSDPVLIELIRMTGNEPISDEEIQAFLEPFHVGPDR
jgi:hypothetical protein